MLTQSTELFALDADSAETNWAYKAEESIRHNAIAIGKNKVFLIDMTLIDSDRLKRLEQQSPMKSKLVCLNAKTGTPDWEESTNIDGTMLVLSTEHDVLLMGSQYSQRKFQLASETGNRLTGFQASNGKRLWDMSQPKQYLSRPLINGRKVYAQPSAWDLLTGEAKQGYSMKGRQPGGCGNISGSKHLLLYRSGPLGYVDLSQHAKGSQSYGPMRPGCWINAIPAGGLVLMPDATDRCKCSYLMKVSVALQTMPEAGIAEPAPGGDSKRRAVAPSETPQE